MDAYRQMEGHFTFCAIAVDEPDVIVGIRKETPLVVGLGEGENFMASAIPAFLAETRTVIFPEDGDVVVVRRDGVEIFDSRRHAGGAAQVQTVDWDDEAAEKAGYETFMLKEIHEQPARSGRHPGRAHRGRRRGGPRRSGPRPPRASRVCAGWSSWPAAPRTHAGLVGKYALERWARMPVEVEVASEFRYRDPVIGPDCLCIAISQSGETADTLAAMRLARQAGARVLAVTNIVGSQATREADGVLFTRAGLEIGVAATKTFLTQVLAMLLLALYRGRAAGPPRAPSRCGPYTRNCGASRRCSATIWRTARPRKVEEVAVATPPAASSCAWGGTTGLPVALEGALKLKEISYVPTEAYAAGEMKHGPIALLEEGSPVVVVATDSTVYDKLVSNVQEVIARGARVIAVASEGNESLAGMANEILYVPRTDEMLSPLLATVPLQLFAYYVAKARGEKVDQPRNLAKTVTVE